MLGGDLIECNEDAWVDTTAIIHEGSVDGLDSGGAGGIKWLRGGFGCWSLWFLESVRWFNPAVRGVLLTDWHRMVEFCEGPVDVAGHGDIDVPLVVVPV